MVPRSGRPGWPATPSSTSPLTAAVAAAPVMRALPAYERAAVLMRASAELAQRRDEIARTLAGEAGKPLKDALIETDRAAMTFHVAADEARRLGGEVVPMDLAAHGAGRLAIVKRVPVGPVAAISPSTFRSTSPPTRSRPRSRPAIPSSSNLRPRPRCRRSRSATSWSAPACPVARSACCRWRGRPATGS